MTENNLPTHVAVSDQTSAMISMIRDVAMAPDADQKVATMRELLAMEKDMRKEMAERAMNEQLAILDIPVVKKNGRIPLPSKDGTVRDVLFAKWEDMARVLKPLLREHGMSLRFDTLPRPGEGGGTILIGFLSHRDGAMRTAQVSLPLDSGPGRNNLQAMGSSISYGKRYVAGMLLNIVTENEDDDGEKSENINVEQAAEIDNLVRETGADLKRFLKWIGAAEILAIPSLKYQKAIDELKRKKEKR